MPVRNVKMKYIRRDILPGTNPENYEIAFKIGIKKSKMIR